MVGGDQLVRYVQTLHGNVAWSAIGQGPPLVFGGWWMSHLEQDWLFDDFREFVERLARHRTVIRFDSPGVGMSTPGQAAPQDLSVQIDALVAVLDDAAARTADLFVGSAGCAVAVGCAARYPERVRSLALYSGYVRGRDIASPDDRDGMVVLVRRYWGVTSRLLTDIYVPDATSREREVFAECQQRTASANRAADALAAVYGIDASAEVASVRAPTLVMHRRDDRAIPFALGRELAIRLPGAQFLELEGANHFPWHGDTGSVLRPLLRHLGVPDARVDELRAGAVARLTPREREIVGLIAQGKTDAQIASDLLLSMHTIHRHVANVRTKLQVRSRAAIIALAHRNGTRDT